MDGIEWIAVDWSESRIRWWAMAAQGQVRQYGEAAAPPDPRHETTLAPLIAHVLQDDAPTDILVAGTPTLPGGWGVAPPKPVPSEPPSAADLVPAATVDTRLAVQLVPGMTQSDPRGILLGDALRVRGFLTENGGFDGVLCITGPRTHWVHVSAGEVVSFQTFLTRDMSGASAQAMSIPFADGPAAPEALDDTLARPERAATRLASIAAGYLMRTTGPEDALSEIRGVWLGAELAAARPYWLGQRVAVLGEGPALAGYAEALSAQGAMVETADGDAALLAGFRSVRAGQKAAGVNR